MTPTPTNHPATLLLKLDEAAAQLRCTRRSLERQIAAGNLRAIHIGRSVRIESQELLAFIGQLRGLGGPGQPDDPHPTADVNPVSAHG